MTVTVTLADGGTDKYMRFGDSYIEHKDGTLDVTRGGAKHAYRYESGGVDPRRRRSQEIEEARFLALITLTAVVGDPFIQGLIDAP
jgi:hypothetical protein